MCLGFVRQILEDNGLVLYLFDYEADSDQSAVTGQYFDRAGLKDVKNPLLSGYNLAKESHCTLCPGREEYLPLEYQSVVQVYFAGDKPCDLVQWQYFWGCIALPQVALVKELTVLPFVLLALWLKR